MSKNKGKRRDEILPLPPFNIAAYSKQHIDLHAIIILKQAISIKEIGGQGQKKHIRPIKISLRRERCFLRNVKINLRSEVMRH